MENNKNEIDVISKGSSSPYFKRKPKKNIFKTILGQSGNSLRKANTHRTIKLSDDSASQMEGNLSYEVTSSRVRKEELNKTGRM